MNRLDILLVDDSPVVRMVITKQLAVLGFVADTVADGKLAVAAVNAKGYDMIFMDVMMPNMDGLEATRQIRKIEQITGRERSRIVGVTGYTNRTECLGAGMDDFLFKPVSIEQLVGAIKQCRRDASMLVTSAVGAASTEHDSQSGSRHLADQRIEDLKLRLGFK